MSDTKWTFDTYLPGHISIAGPDDLKDYALRIEFSDALSVDRKIALSQIIVDALNANAGG